jgi:quinol-cytochrome oxidoreductase complex cytochrome b subunit
VFVMVIKSANLALRFLLELCALAALGYWGFQTGRGLFMKIGLGIGAPLLAALVWGTFVAPHAAVPVSAPLRLVLELVVFGSAAAALYAAGRPALAGSFALTVVINRVLMHLWGQ